MEESPSDTHQRCFSHNHQYNHEHVQSALDSKARMNGSKDDFQIYEIEIVFHVLSPPPGLEQAREEDLYRHLHMIVESINADYAGRAFNADSAKTHHALFKKSKCLQLHQSKYGMTPTRVSQVQSIQSSHPEADMTDPVCIYQRYIQLKVDTGIRFKHTGLKDRCRLKHNAYATPLCESHLKQLKLGDPDFAAKANQIIKTTQSGGSDAIPNCLNVWIVHLPHSLLGFSTFPWEQAGMMDGVCVSNQVAGIHFSNCEGTDFRRYNQYHTFTHEIAHTLGLLHTFNQDLRQDPFTHTSRVKHINDDFVLDTPDQDRASQGNVYEHTNWPQDKRDDAQPYQFMNFMDYANDECMFLFTPGQRDRMRQVIITYRENWLCPTAISQFRISASPNDVIPTPSIHTPPREEAMRSSSYADKILFRKAASLNDQP